MKYLMILTSLMILSVNLQSQNFNSQVISNKICFPKDEAKQLIIINNLYPEIKLKLSKVESENLLLNEKLKTSLQFQKNETVKIFLIGVGTGAVAQTILILVLRAVL